jgi:hypothetical protein
MPKETHLAAAELHESAAVSHRAAAEAFDRGDQNGCKHDAALALDFSKRANEASKHAQDKSEKHPWAII